MDIEFNKGNPVVRLRAFRAIDDPQSCELFADGHKRVLTSIGVEKVTSSNNEWMNNPAAFVMIVESLDKKQGLGNELTLAHVFLSEFLNEFPRLF